MSNGLLFSKSEWILKILNRPAIFHILFMGAIKKNSYEGWRNGRRNLRIDQLRTTEPQLKITGSHSWKIIILDESVHLRLSLLFLYYCSLFSYSFLDSCFDVFGTKKCQILINDPNLRIACDKDRMQEMCKLSCGYCGMYRTISWFLYVRFIEFVTLANIANIANITLLKTLEYII